MTERSKTVIGWLPATTVAPPASGNEAEVEEQEAGLHDFVQNGMHICRRFSVYMNCTMPLLT